MGKSIPLTRFFMEEYWAVAFRALSEEQEDRLSCDTRVSTYRLVPPPRGGWAADPFLIAENGVTALYCEMVKKHDKKGVIGCAIRSGGHFSRPVPVLELPYHLSYPAVFRSGGTLYMIPETRQARTLELFCCTRFPDQWTRKATLMSGREWVDTTPYVEQDGSVTLFLYEPDDENNVRTLYTAPLDPASGTLGALRPAACYRAKLGRPAGLLLETEHGPVRPTQHSVKRYGERIVYKRVEKKKDGYEEYDVATLSPASVRVGGLNTLLGVHTVNRLDGLEVIDVFYRRFMPFRPVSALLARLKRRLRG